MSTSGHLKVPGLAGHPHTWASTTTGARIGVITAAVLHLGLAVIPYAASGLVAPGWAVVVLWAVWLALAVGLVVLARRGAGWLTLLVPAVALVCWLAVLSAGSWLLGWTA